MPLSVLPLRGVGCESEADSSSKEKRLRITLTPSGAGQNEGLVLGTKDQTQYKVSLGGRRFVGMEGAHGGFGGGLMLGGIAVSVG